MKSKLIREFLSLRDIRNAILGVIIVGGGLGLSGLTYYAFRIGDQRLAGTAAVLSLVFVLLILVFVVPPLARNAGREASQMNLPFDFTMGGAIMLGLIAIVGFSAWNTGNNLLFLVLSFLAAAMIVGFLAGNACLKKIDVKMRFPETIYAGVATPIRISLHNRKRVFPSYSIVAEVRGSETERSIVADELESILPRFLVKRIAKPPIVGRTLNYFVNVPRNETVENKTDHIFPNRGRILIKDFELSTRFPFGFFRHRRRLPARETELIVFPAPVSVESELENLPLDIGRLTANKRGLGQDLLALRDYQPNDDLRRVDWKATARTQQLTVREFSAEDDRRVTIFFDTRVSETEVEHVTLREKLAIEQSGKRFVVSERFETGVSIVASLFSHFAESQAEVRLVVGREKGEFGIGGRHLIESLKRLASVEPVLIAEDDELDLAVFESMMDERLDSHNVLVTGVAPEFFLADSPRELSILRF